MTKRMLIDATHAEETRVVVLDGSRLEDYDVETATKKQLKGNIYLAKVVRVEPSLQAAFVEYGGNRHGFLAFAEIHPDYYQIPVADRQKLLAMQEAEARAAEEAEEEQEAAASAEFLTEIPTPEMFPGESAPDSNPPPGEAMDGWPADEWPGNGLSGDGLSGVEALTSPVAEISPPEETGLEEGSVAQPDLGEVDREALKREEPGPEEPGPEEPGLEEPGPEEGGIEADGFAEVLPPETVGGEGESSEDFRPQRMPAQFLRQYKIQEVIHRRQILLVQVVKEERGAKGAALTTYISLAGRYCVLMPNSPRGGGISRKITSPADRRRLKEAVAELSIPSGMGLIVRTAGANRPKPEIRRDCEYLLRLWDEIRETVMKSVAPALIYEEASLIKRAIRDVYSRDLEEVLVDGETGWQAARDFMRMLMPTHARKVQLWKDPAGRGLFSHEHVEAELDAVMSPTVPLRSGGSLVINQTEALVAIDVNSGRSTRERNIEETALRTNLEAAEEVARQLRLRDLAGLIVIDFIDMESRKHNSMVERRLKEALKSDRARVQVGHISHFGLLEMSRQRLRPSLAETSFLLCPHCEGTGHVRSIESAAIRLLRLIEDDASRRRAGELMVHVSGPVALYVFNHKRAWLAEIEARHGITLQFALDEHQPVSFMRIEHLRGATAAVPAPVSAPIPGPAAAAEPPPASPPTLSPVSSPAAPVPQPAPALTEEGEAETQAGEETEEGDRRRRRRRRRRRGHREEAAPSPLSVDGVSSPAKEVPPEQAEQPEITPPPESPLAEPPVRPQAAAAHPRRRGPREGGREGRGRGARVPAVPPESQPALPHPIGPTPANPFADAALDFLDALEVEAESMAAPPPAIAYSEEPAEPAPVPPEPAPERASASLPAPEAVAPAMAAAPVDDRPAEPAVKPIVIGADEPVDAPKKRGWWRH
ncbi:MAG TPA: ribonuclease E/G [Acetobacteraceae bacterium]|nr:ribonuclease E/G [Acetobacteraceae bacterium]